MIRVIDCFLPATLWKGLTTYEVQSVGIYTSSGCGVCSKPNNTGPSQCLTVSHSVSQCLTMSHSVSQCLTVSHSVSQCLTVSHSVSQCLTVSHSVSQCLTVSHSFEL